MIMAIFIILSRGIFLWFLMGALLMPGTCDWILDYHVLTISLEEKYRKTSTSHSL